MSNLDAAWKEAIGRYFPDFLWFFFPHVAVRIDWSRGFQMLDTELQALGMDSPGVRRVDCLVRVSLWTVGSSGF